MASPRDRTWLSTLVVVLATLGATGGATAWAGALGGHRVCGRVGDDYAHADLVVTLQPGDATTRTDTDGRFCFEKVAAGDHIVGVAAYCLNVITCFPDQRVAVDGSDVEVALVPQRCDSSALHVYPATVAPGGEVEVVGFCQCLHSGRRAPLSLDGSEVGQVSGDTGGCFRAHVTLAPDTRGGPHTFTVPLRGSPIVGATGSVRVPAAPGCTGDCDGSEVVTIDELLRGVGVALSTRPLSECRAIDASGDGTAMIDEVTAAVGRALRGCPALLAPVTLEAAYDVIARFARGDQRGLAIVRDAGGGELSLEMIFSPLDWIHVRGSVQPDGTVRLSGGTIQGGDIYSPAVGTASADLDALAQRIDGTLEVVDFFNGTEIVDFSLRRPASGTSGVDTNYRVTLQHAASSAPTFRSTMLLYVRDFARRGLATCDGAGHFDEAHNALPDLEGGACALSPDGLFSFITRYRDAAGAGGPPIRFFGTLSAAASGVASAGSFSVGSFPDVLDNGSWTAEVAPER